MQGMFYFVGHMVTVLPWQLHQSRDKDSLRKCLLNMLVLQKIMQGMFYFVGHMVTVTMAAVSIQG